MGGLVGLVALMFSSGRKGLGPCETQGCVFRTPFRFPTVSGSVFARLRAFNKALWGCLRSVSVWAHI